MKRSLASSCAAIASLLAAGAARADDAGAALDGTAFTLSIAGADGRVLDADTLASYFGPARCACPSNVTVTLEVAADSASQIGSSHLEATLVIGGDCDNVAATDCRTVGTLLTLDASKLSSSESVDTATVFRAATGADSCAQRAVSTTRLWAVIRQDGARMGSPPSLALGAGGTAPGAPTAVTVETADSGLLVSWQAAVDPSAIAGYQVLCSPGPASPPAPAYESCTSTPAAADAGALVALDDSRVCSELVSSSATSVRVHGLDNGHTYAVAVLAIGKDGTPGAPSASVDGVPGPTLGFDDLYQQGGGTATGGCALGGRRDGGGGAADLVGTAVLAVALALRRARRRRRRPRVARAASLMLAVLALAATPAHGAPGDAAPSILDGRASGSDADRDDGRALASPRRWTLELRFGPYRPDVDSEFADRGSGARPFVQTFGSSRHLMSGLEIDRHLLHRGGTLAVGFGAGYYSVSARALAADGQTRTGDETALRLIPLSVSLVFRADRPHLATGFPFIPYAKAGVDAALWSITDTAKPSALQGYTLGWHAAAGLALTLDLFDPEAAGVLDRESGVNQTALFLEVTRTALDGLGTGSSLRLGDTTWIAGLLLEM